MSINEEKRLLRKICYNSGISRIDKIFVIFGPIFKNKFYFIDTRVYNVILFNQLKIKCTVFSKISKENKKSL